MAAERFRTAYAKATKCVYVTTACEISPELPTSPSGTCQNRAVGEQTTATVVNRNLGTWRVHHAGTETTWNIGPDRQWTMADGSTPAEQAGRERAIEGRVHPTTQLLLSAWATWSHHGFDPADSPWIVHTVAFGAARAVSQLDTPLSARAASWVLGKAGVPDRSVVTAHLARRDVAAEPAVAAALLSPRTMTMVDVGHLQLHQEPVPVAALLAANPNCAPSVLTRLIADPDPWVQRGIVQNPAVPDAVVLGLIQRRRDLLPFAARSRELRAASPLTGFLIAEAPDVLAARCDLDHRIVTALADNARNHVVLLSSRADGAADGPRVLRLLAASPAIHVRRSVAAHPNTPDDLLVRLAFDPEPSVAFAASRNPRRPAAAPCPDDAAFARALPPSGLALLLLDTTDHDAMAIAVTRISASPTTHVDSLVPLTRRIAADHVPPGLLESVATLIDWHSTSERTIDISQNSQLVDLAEAAVLSLWRQSHRPTPSAAEAS